VIRRAGAPRRVRNLGITRWSVRLGLTSSSSVA
jgi:hypothetical protein